MFEDLIALFAQRPTIKFTLERDLLRVLPHTSDEYEAVIRQARTGEYTVWLDSWHEEFQEYPPARDCFLFGLSDRCRIKVFKKASFRFRWVLEYRNGAEWIEDSSTMLLFYPFWRKTTFQYLTNNSLND